MALTSSTMLEIRTPAPHFSLPDVVSGRTVSLEDFRGKKALVVMFICNHCPYVQHVKHELARLAKDYAPKNVGFVAICPNDAQRYPDDAPEKLKQLAEQAGFTFPVCYDETQEVAKAYAAACTPDFYIFDEHPKLVYRGQLDSSRPGNEFPPDGADIRAALETIFRHSGLVATAALVPGQVPSTGCSIKWKPGNEPGYFLSAQHRGA